MGYTHYWTFNAPKRGKTKAVNTAFKAAIQECALIVHTYSQVNGGLSGYSAHTKPGEYGGLFFNGAKDDAHETFVIREHYKENIGFAFCKTAQKPYDVCVTACLIVLANRLGEYINVSSDGDTHDWQDGLRLARKLTENKALAIPSGIRYSKPKLLVTK